MDVKTKELLKKATNEALEDVIHAENAEEKNKALHVATELLDRQLECDKVEETKKSSKIGTVLQCVGAASPFITLGVKYIIDKKHIREICKLEQIDTFVSSAGKGLIRSWFTFKH